MAERPLTERLEAIHTALERRKLHPVGPRLGSFAVAMQQRLRNPHDPLYSLTIDTLTVRPKIGSSHFITLVQRGLQARTYGNPDFRDPQKGYVFPEDFLSVDAWHQLVDRVLDDPDLHGNFAFDVLTRDPQSNVFDRYKNVKAFAVIAHKLGRLPVFKMLDVGCSLNIGERWLASSIRAEPTEVITPDDEQTGIRMPDVLMPSLTSYRNDHGLQRALGAIINDPLSLEYGLGLDREDPANFFLWAAANSLNPDELMNTHRVATFDYLATTKDFDSKVKFRRRDFDDIDEAELEALAAMSGEETPGWPIVNLSAIVYQDPEKMPGRLEKAKRLTKRFLLVSDFMTIKDGELILLDDWDSEPFPWMTAVWDVEDPEASWQPLALATNGRVEQVTLADGKMNNEKGDKVSLWSPIQELIIPH
jgi:hypothetical protein